MGFRKFVFARLTLSAGLALGSVVPAFSHASDADVRTVPTGPLIAANGQVVSIEFEKSAQIVAGENGTNRISMIGADARTQLIVQAAFDSGLNRDVTRAVTFLSEPAGIVQVDQTGLITPIANGTAVITAKLNESITTSVTVDVTKFDGNQPVCFPNQIIPIFTKYGCNGGGCHGKIAGQNGFKLSLLGFEPREDYEHLVKESRGRRLFPASPDQSLLLTKATNESPHGGGQRIEKDSFEYRLLRRWIAQGMPYGTGQDPVVAKIEVTPRERQMGQNGEQQICVTAVYSDGTIEDVTRAAQFDSNDQDMAEITKSGLVSTRELAGDVAIMARYLGHVDVFRGSVPLGAKSENWPESRGPIDTAVFNKLKKLGIPPSALCDDATFIRRVTIDLAGRLPLLEETQEFLANSDPNKRNIYIDRLLNSPDYADYFAAKWNAILRNRRQNQGFQSGTFAFHDWIRESLISNKPYDQFVREILTASGSVSDNPPVAWYREVTETTSRVEDAAQLFLGQRIQCARCHHHPFEKWSQADYYQMTAFFSLVSKKDGGTPEDHVYYSRIGTASANHPKTGAPLKPSGLDGAQLDIPPTEDPRQYLVDWMVKPDNPFFARSLVNRYWKHFFGRGIVDPEDDLRVTNPPSNPELMDALAASFVESRYDLKQLARAICQSATYQLSSDASEANLRDRKSYSRYFPKRMAAETLLDAIDQVTGATTSFDGMPAGTRAVSLPDTSFNSYFLTVFGRPESSTACECERGQESNLAQSLHLLNSNEMQAKLSVGQGIAARFATETSRSNEEKVTELYLRAFSRTPTPTELERSTAYLTSKSNSKESYEDLIWAIVNSKEFLFNH
jgi:Protein of unknown function (DUF1553)/Protein of unknown function (DUF1549)